MKKGSSNIIGFLPEEMLSEILKHAASNSVTEFINLKISCKGFLGASNYDYIFEDLSLKDHSYVPWRKNQKIFLKKCKDAKNAEALYRKGMVNYFSRRKTESGLLYLKKAVEKHHVEAIYAYGIILLCSGDEVMRKQGFQVLSFLNFSSLSKTSSRITSCRWKINKLLSNIWVFVSLAEPVKNPQAMGCNCDEESINQLMISEGQLSWEASNNYVDNRFGCDSCFWDHEAAFFCSMIRKYLVN